jgi:hypothetical protein
MPLFASDSLKLRFRVADGNTWWYGIACPWDGAYYASADT